MTRGWFILAVFVLLISCGPRTAEQDNSKSFSNGETSAALRDSGAQSSDTARDTTHLKAPDSLGLSRLNDTENDAVLRLTVPEILKS